MFYPKWAPSPAEPAHNLQNQEIIWFLHYNVIHSPTSLSAIVQLYEYIFSSHGFPHPFFLRVLLRFSVIWTNDGFKADMTDSHAEEVYLGVAFVPLHFGCIPICLHNHLPKTS